MKAILKKDVASCLAVHNKFLILGSHWGCHPPTGCHGDLSSLQASPGSHHHCLPGMMIIIIISGKSIILLQVSVHHAGEYYFSCSDDGCVVFTEKSTHNFNNQHGLDRPVKSIAIYLIYARANSGRRFMAGVEGSSRTFSA